MNSPNAKSSMKELRRVVLFDGRCSLCERSRRWAERLDWFGKVAWVSFREPEVRALVPQLNDEQLEKEMWVVTDEGQMLAGFEGWRSLLKVFPLTMLPALLLYFPSIPFIGRKVYAFIAARRPVVCRLQPPARKPGGDWKGLLERAANRRTDQWNRRKNLKRPEVIGETVNH